jgi:hypothetical protein
MRRIRKVDTKPELIVRRVAHRLGHSTNAKHDHESLALIAAAARALWLAAKACSVRFRAVTGRPSRQLPRLGWAKTGHPGLPASFDPLACTRAGYLGGR